MRERGIPFEFSVKSRGRNCRRQLPRRVLIFARHPLFADLDRPRGERALPRSRSYQPKSYRPSLVGSGLISSGLVSSSFVSSAILRPGVGAVAPALGRASHPSPGTLWARGWQRQSPFCCPNNIADRAIDASRASLQFGQHAGGHARQATALVQWPEDSWAAIPRGRFLLACCAAALWKTAWSNAST